MERQRKLGVRNDGARLYFFKGEVQGRRRKP